MKDWVTLITAIIQLLTAAMMLLKSREKEKGTHKRRIRRRR
ncbi:hypothetical protein [Paenibacillus macerans]|nr:hypothetical protein [Paenibacillus macerans]